MSVNWKFWQRRKPPVIPLDKVALKQRLAALDKTDPLFPLLLGWLDAQIVAQADGRVSEDMAAQFIGRLNMCADLKQEWRNVWLEAHRPPK